VTSGFLFCQTNDQYLKAMAGLARLSYGIFNINWRLPAMIRTDKRLTPPPVQLAGKTLPAGVSKNRLATMITSVGRTPHSLAAPQAKKSLLSQLGQWFRSRFSPAGPRIPGRVQLPPITLAELRRLPEHPEVWFADAQRFQGPYATLYCNEILLPMFVGALPYCNEDERARMKDFLMNLPAETCAGLNLGLIDYYRVSDFRSDLTFSLICDNPDTVALWSHMLDRLSTEQLPILERFLVQSEHDQKILKLLVGDTSLARDYSKLKQQLSHAIEASGQSQQTQVPDYISAMSSAQELLSNDIFNDMLDEHFTGQCLSVRWIRAMTQNQMKQVPCDWSKVLFPVDAQGNCRLEQAFKQGLVHKADPLLLLLNVLPSTVLWNISPPESLVRQLRETMSIEGSGRKIRSGDKLLAKLEEMLAWSSPSSSGKQPIRLRPRAQSI
jgi:hypothetical protein